MDTSIEPSSPPPAPVPQPAEDAEVGARPPRRTAFWVTLVAVALLMGGWLYVLFVYDPGLMIDELADRTFPNQAEEVCAAAVAELDVLPPANLATDAGDRADTVAQSNVILAAMIEDLRPLVPAVPSGGSAEARRAQQKVHDGVTEWLDDWETYIDNREQYVENLREDPDARFLESTKGTSTKGITRAINGFAEVNHMVSCSTPADLS